MPTTNWRLWKPSLERSRNSSILPMHTLTIFLNEKESAALYQTKSEQRDGGGFQALLVRFQERLDDETGQLELSREELAMIQRHFNFARGGYQGRLKRIFGRHFPPSLPSRIPTRENSVCK